MLVLKKKIVSVTELTSSIKELLESNYRFVTVRGEVSNLKTPYSGHSYFTLKDKDAQIRAILFKNQKRYLIKPIEEGKEIICHGRISLYEPRGDYQIIIDTIEEAGHGELQLKFEQLKRDLSAKGYFDSELKKPIPEIPQNICVITSATGAAFQDFLKIYNERQSTAHIQLLPVVVQGTKAGKEIAGAIATANKSLKPDVIVLCRGGGSIEDLWAFNEEIVADAIYKSKIPIVTGVGHQTDFTIADFCADHRVATPTGAAELLTGDTRNLYDEIQNYKRRLIRSINDTISAGERQLKINRKSLSQITHLLDKSYFRLQLSESYLRTSFENFLQSKETSLSQTSAKLKENAPLHRIELQQEKLSHLSKRLHKQLSHTLEAKCDCLAKQSALLHSVSPLAVMSRGYSVVYKDTTSNRKTVINNSEQVQVNDKVTIRMHSGQIKCEVIAKED